jgi:predicted DNA-binding protein (MmcQ/YjbR family)
MDLLSVQRFCLSLPHVTESVLWENNLVFKVGGKMFAVASLEPDKVWVAFKCSPDDFADLTERIGIIPAPYLARAQWVGLEHARALTRAELEWQLKRAHEIVFASLPRKTREALTP